MSDNKYYVNYKTGRSPIAVIHTPTRQARNRCSYFLVPSGSPDRDEYTNCAIRAGRALPVHWFLSDTLIDL